MRTIERWIERAVAGDPRHPRPCATQALVKERRAGDSAEQIAVAVRRQARQSRRARLGRRLGVEPIELAKRFEDSGVAGDRHRHRPRRST